uniref:C2H2-type domain-containing protein n=1 Tax=Musca domestica TaxID=7370 RepID=A0A1I8MFU0_MUSDO
MNADLDDTHLCIKCSQTIIGLENYIQHRKQNCNRNTTTATVTTTNTKDSTSHTVTPSEHRNSDVTPPINYEPFNFNEPEQPTAASHGGKSSKNLGESYELPYELGADVFFSSLQLQSVQSSVAHHPVATHQSSGGKTGGPGQLQRQKSLQSDHSSHEVESWMATHHGDQHGSDNLLKAVNDMGEAKKSYEALFKPITYEHESPELSEEEEDDEADVDEIDDDDDEDYEPEAEGHATGGKWKLPLLRHSPPVVPATHTGGKWKPEHRPNLRVTHSQLSRLSPNWDDHMDDVDINDCQHPPSDHTKGKWIPGTKVQRLEYKEAVELAKHSTKQDYWCNICCRKLKSKAIYENHLKTSYPLKRYEPETQLEKAVIEEIPREDINKGFAVKTAKMHAVTTASTSAIGKKRKRRSTFLRCSLCKHVMSRHLIGKHLISHYHYRRMQLHPGLSLHMILDNIHSIVLQSPFQCRPCRFYANTEEAFLLHWSSASHLDASEGPGRFWCSYCRFECEDNNQMRRHLLSPEHKEVLLAINRSVPICISKRRTLSCLKCGSGFRYNFELRRHIRSHHPEMEYFGTASDIYQSKFKCLTCPEVLPSQIALQRHEKFKHSVSKYFCSICSLEFNSPCKARRHRKTLEHKQKASGIEKKNAKNMGEEKSTMDFEIRDIIEISKPKVSDSILATDSFITIYSDNMEYDVRCVSLHPAAELKWKDSVELKEWKTSNTCATENPITVIQDKIKIETNSDDEPCTSAEAIKREKLRKSLEIKKTNKCLNCQEIFQSRDQLIAHREKEHSLSVCMVCGEKFVNGQKLGQHLRKCKPKILGNRETSDSNAGTKGDVEMTSQEAKVTPEHGDVLRKCDLCEFVSPYESEIIFHNLYHTNVSMATQDQIKCPLCEKTFRKQSLRCHLRRHTNEKIFECTLCGLKYARKYNLKDHIDRVHGTVNKLEMGVVNQNIQKKDFQCDSCEKVFKSKRSLQDHCLTHHDSKPNHRFVCPRDSCDYRTHNKSLLKVHLASHSIESFKCPEKGCDSVGKSEFHLKRI